MKKEILAIIPARGGSKGISKKNIKLFSGKPLIQYTIEEAKKSSFITRAILSSDDTQIIGFCRKKGLEAPFIRPKSLSKDATPMIDVVLHAVSFLNIKENYVPDYVVLLQPTSPLRKASHIDEALYLLLTRRADSVVSVTEAPHNCNPYSLMRLRSGFLEPFMKSSERGNIRQLKPKFFARNGPAILAFTSKTLIQYKSMYGKRIIPYIMPKEASIDIDDSIDFKVAEFTYKEKLP